MMYSDYLPRNMTCIDQNDAITDKIAELIRGECGTFYYRMRRINYAVGQAQDWNQYLRGNDLTADVRIYNAGRFVIFQKPYKGSRHG